PALLSMCLHHSHSSLLSASTAADTTDVYTLSLHDALPISPGGLINGICPDHLLEAPAGRYGSTHGWVRLLRDHTLPNGESFRWRSEEHTSELQSRFDLVCRLLLEKKK